MDFDICCLSVPVWCTSQSIIKFFNLPIYGEITDGKSICMIIGNIREKLPSGFKIRFKVELAWNRFQVIIKQDKR